MRTRCSEQIARLRRQVGGVLRGLHHGRAPAVLGERRDQDVHGRQRLAVDVPVLADVLARHEATRLADFIIGSLAITLFAIVVGGPFGIAVGVFLTELCPPRMAGILKPCIEMLVGIPSVVYGWLGLTLLVPLVRNLTGSPGFGLMAAGIVLAIMILPTVISLSEDALHSVPGSIRKVRWRSGRHAGRRSRRSSCRPPRAD